jgi:hypothetical protein
VKCRFTKSGARAAAGSGIVVRAVRARVTPRHPWARIYAPNKVGNFCFEVTLGYRRLERGR